MKESIKPFKTREKKQLCISLNAESYNENLSSGGKKSNLFNRFTLRKDLYKNRFLKTFLCNNINLNYLENLLMFLVLDRYF